MATDDDKSSANSVSRRDFLKFLGAGAAVMSMGAAASVLSSNKEPIRQEALAQPEFINHSMWIHGNSIQIEHPEQLTVILHQGDRTHLEGSFDFPTHYLCGDILRQKKIAHTVACTSSISSEICHQYYSQ